MEQSLIIAIISLVVGIIFIVRWWKMTTHIKEIRDFLLKNQSEERKDNVEKQTNVASVTEDDFQQVEILKEKLKNNSCIVKGVRTGRIECWSKNDWEDFINDSNTDKSLFNILYKNF